MNPFLKISLNIVAVFAILMLASFLPDYLRDFFGDEYCSGWIVNPNTKEMEMFWHYGSEHKTPTYHWGYRHWLWSAMGLFLFVFQVVRVAMIIDKSKFN